MKDIKDLYIEAYDVLEEELGREPTDQEIAKWATNAYADLCDSAYEQIKADRQERGE